MTGFVTFIHILACAFLMTVILMQSGRGGGLTEGFSSAESLFGAKTNAFMVKATSILAALFLATCLGLAVLSTQKGRSLMAGKGIVPKSKPVAAAPAATPPAEKQPAAPITASTDVTVLPAKENVPASGETQNASAAQSDVQPAPVVQSTVPVEQKNP